MMYTGVVTVGLGVATGNVPTVFLTTVNRKRGFRQHPEVTAVSGRHGPHVPS